MTATSTMPPPHHRPPPTSTPAPFRIATASVSAPPPRWANGEMNNTNNSIYPCHTITTTTPMNDPHNMEDRVSNLAWRLQMDMPPPSSSSSSTDNQQQQHQPSNNNDPRLEEIRQFVDSLKSMQIAVTNTMDEGQRTKKSRALNTLLTMFERVLETSSKGVVVVASSSSSSSTDQKSIECREDSVIRQRHLEATVQRLNNENRQLSTLCRERDGRLQHLTDEVRRLRLESGRLVDENDRLRSSEARAREECARMRDTAHRAEYVRDGILADYARLTEENVELRRDASDARVADDGALVELEACRAEMKRLRDVRDRMESELRTRAADIVELRREVANAKLLDDNNIAAVTEQFETCRVEMTKLRAELDETTDTLQRKTNELANVERRMDELHDRLISERRDRRRLEEELSHSRRSTTNASEQLLRLREQFSKARTREVDDNLSLTLSAVKPDDDVSTTRSKSMPEQKGSGETLEGVMTMLSSRSSTSSSSYRGIVDKAVAPSLSSHGRGVRMEDVPVTNNDDDLRARVDKLNAQLDDLISPRSGKSSLDWTHHGTTIATLHNSKSNSGDDPLSPTTSDASSQREITSRGVGMPREGLSMTTTTTSNVDDEPKTRLMRNSTVDELIDEFSLDGIDSIKDSIFDENGGGGMNRTKAQHHQREENTHPNHLMEYFYGQIKLAK